MIRLMQKKVEINKNIKIMIKLRQTKNKYLLIINYLQKKIKKIRKKLIVYRNKKIMKIIPFYQIKISKA